MSGQQGRGEEAKGERESSITNKKRKRKKKKKPNYPSMWVIDPGVFIVAT